MQTIHESAASRRDHVTRQCANAQSLIESLRRGYDVASFRSTMIRCRLARSGYDLQAGTPREGVTMTVEMRREMGRLEEQLGVMCLCRTRMEEMDSKRKDLLWNTMRLEDFERVEAEAEAKAKAKAEAEEIGTGKLKGEKDVEGEDKDVEEQNKDSKH
ncbi:uncharacterized protein H6S33_007939 [Morchella sextelata]|uniref:uncharacterized protein n=1 Tax=Morchella sextelata TaxID=1174677 RepID=UPI001D052493|nr:uncharacterized protein H6S33_007939 [Morchella sextelata]KAH0602935.1 hypothetical protein H6S33_007939 [Morchella sextelata]